MEGQYINAFYIDPLTDLTCMHKTPRIFIALSSIPTARMADAGTDRARILDNAVAHPAYKPADGNGTSRTPDCQAPRLRRCDKRRGG